MSDTPRTDHQEMSPRLDIEGTVVSSDFARQLERELAKAREQRDTLAEALEDIASRRLNDHMGPHDMSLCCVTLAQAALAAVKGGKHD